MPPKGKGKKRALDVEDEEDEASDYEQSQPTKKGKQRASRSRSASVAPSDSKFYSESRLENDRTKTDYCQPLPNKPQQERKDRPNSKLERQL